MAEPDSTLSLTLSVRGTWKRLPCELLTLFSASLSLFPERTFFFHNKACVNNPSDKPDPQDVASSPEPVPTEDRARADFITRRPSETLSDYYRRLGEKSDREDLVMFINACFAATRQNEFYTDRFEQTVSIEFLHLYVMANYREIYAKSLATGINHFNQCQIVLNLLNAGAPLDQEHKSEEGRLIAAALKRLPPNRVLGLFGQLKSRRINNRRTRAVIKQYLEQRREPEFDAVKYARKYRAAARHAHLKLNADMGAFLFAFRKTKKFETELFDRVKQAHYSASAIYDLPFTIAESLAVKHNVPRDVFFKKIEHKMTKTEKLRFQTSAAKHKRAKLNFDLSQAGLTRLAIYVLSLPPSQRLKQADEIADAFKESTRRAIAAAPFRLGKVAAILDRSRSTAGSRQKQNRPLAIAMAINELLKQAASQYKAFWTLPIDGEHDFSVTPKGQTGIADPLLDALEWQPDLILIVSDGYENDPPGAANQIVHAFGAMMKNKSNNTTRVPEILHLNPVFDSDHFSPKPFGEAIATVGLRDAEDLATMLGFARFASGAAKLDELKQHLSQLAADFN